MYCVACGMRNPSHGKFCLECGAHLVPLPSAETRPVQVNTRPSEEDVLRSILQTDQRLLECHQCGSTGDLTTHEFGIAKVIATKRDWTDTAASLGVSAVSIALAPLIGAAMVGWKSPSKTTSYRILKAQLVLCRSCLANAWKTPKGTALKNYAYECHPWTEKARQIGYDTLLSANELSKLTPASGGRKK
jgi:hypothetical protein